MRRSTDVASQIAPDETRPSGEFVIDRSGEAKALADYVLTANSRFVVLYGSTDSGKTELLNRWLISRLRAAADTSGRDIVYGACAPRFPQQFDRGSGAMVSLDDVVCGKSIVVVDDFERLLDLPRDEQRAELELMFRSFDARTSARIVLVTDTRQLNSVFALASFTPDVTSAVRELPALTIAQALTRLSDGMDGTLVAYDADTLDAISADCTTLGANEWSDALDLAKLVHRWALTLRNTSGPGPINLASYVEAGRLAGLLRTHLTRQLDLLRDEKEEDQDIARAILERLLDVRAPGAALDLSDLGRRLGVPQSEIDRVLRSASGENGVFRHKRNGELHARPQQLLDLIREDLATRKQQIDRIQRSVTEGLRDWQRRGSLLGTYRFADIHAVRCDLALDAEQLRFLLHCALLYDPDPVAGQAQYWLDRLGDGEDGVNVLLLSLVGDRTGVRLRAARLLAQFRSADVADRLCSVVLSDPDPAVRAQALGSLESMKTPDVMTTLIRESVSQTGRSRAEAIRALQIFPTKNVVDVLATIAADDTGLPLRVSAIETLSKLEIPESVDALLDIALHNKDSDDRDSAASALASVKRPELNRRIFSHLSATIPARTRVVEGLVGVVALLLFGIWLAASRSALNEPQVSFWLPVLGFLIPVVASRGLMAQLRDQQTTVRSWRGSVAVAVFILSTLTVFPLFHGLAHGTVGRWRRAALLFGLEVLGLVFIFYVAPFLEMAPALWLFARLYTVVGWVLIVGTYLVDVVGVFIDVIAFPSTAHLTERRNAVYEHLFTNESAASLVFESIENPTPEAIPFAKQLLGRFGRRVPPTLLIKKLEGRHPATRKLVSRALQACKVDETVHGLQVLWGDSGTAPRRSIARILYQNPNERSLEALDTIRASMTPVQRVRASAARWVYKVMVWPREVRWAVLALLPVLAVFLYNANKELSNPAWDQIARLQQSSVSRAEKLKIIQFTSDVYPTATASDLLDLLRKDERKRGDSVHAALFSALAHIDADSLPFRVEMHDALIHEASEYQKLLSSPSPDTFRIALGVLESSATAPDSVLARTSIAYLMRYLSAAPSIGDTVPNATRAIPNDSLASRRAQALAAVGHLPYDRALPLLDRLISLQLRNKLPESKNASTDLLISALSRLSLLAVTSTLNPDSGRARTKLLHLLDSLPHAPKSIAGNLRRVVQSDEARKRVCDNPNRQDCGAKQAALQYIDENPSSEVGYRDLFHHYAETNDYSKAAEVFERLKLQYPDAVWPRKLLSEIEHENLSESDTAYLRKSYDELNAARSLSAYKSLKTSAPDDYDRLEADYLETALTARHFAETDTLAKRLLARSSLVDRRFNAALFAYLAHVVGGDTAGAGARLVRLDSLVRASPPRFLNNWSYPGTTVFVRHSGIPGRMQDAALKLCKAGPWYNRKDAAAVIDENRRALAMLR